MIKRKIVKSNASSVHPSQAAPKAYHWSLVGSLYQGMLFALSTAVAMAHLSVQSGSLSEPCAEFRPAMRECPNNFTARRAAGSGGLNIRIARKLHRVANLSRQVARG